MKKKEDLTDYGLLNIITPMGFDFTRNHLYIGENEASIHGIIRYPNEVKMGWLEKLTNIENTVVALTFDPFDSMSFVDGVSRNIAKNRRDELLAKDPLTEKRAAKSAADGERIMTEVDQKDQIIGNVSTTIMVLGNNASSRLKNIRRVKNSVSSLRCKQRVLANLQKDALKTLSPFNSIDPITKNMLDRPMPLSTFIGGFPFSCKGFSDNTGTYFARDKSGGIIALDLWKREADRTNSNIVVMGIAGVGKSTAIKHMIYTEFIQGTKIIIIDPEREYKDLCNNLGGDWINVGGSSKGKINPLQIRPTPKDSDNEDDEDALPDMAKYLKVLEVFYDLYLPEITQYQRSLLLQATEELYEKFNITWDTDVSKLKNNDFPVFSDLYQILNDKAEMKDQNSMEYSTLSSLIRNIAVGSDSFIWNGYTTVETDSACICLDTHDLQEASDTIKRTQYFNILTWAWEKMSKDRKEKVMLFCDEAYLMIDPNVPQSTVFLRNVSKRARKYNAGLAVISHSVVDFLDEKIKMYGQAILDMATYKIIMGTNGKNLEELRSLYKLTDAETEICLAKQRGEAIFSVGSKRVHVKFELPAYQLELFGKGGGN